MNTTAITCDKHCDKLLELKSNYATMISHFSHELRNPLTLINSELQLLESDCPAIVSTSLWTQIRQDMNDVIHLLKQLSSYNQGTLTQNNTFFVSDFLQNIASGFFSAMLEKQIYFSLQILDLPANLIITGDEFRLKEVFTNLLINAMDSFSDNEKQISKQIVLSAALNNQILTIHVRDNGTGIPSEYIPSLFDPFVTHKTHGTGLGLSIAKNIIKNHGGTITLSTSCAPGASYTDFCVTMQI